MPTIHSMPKITPLANLLRPATLDEVIGQGHLVNDKGPLRLMALSGKLFSTILWGPPGSGKTTVIRALAADAGANFVNLNATALKIEDVRKVVKEAGMALDTGRQTAVFIDECLPYNTLIRCRLSDGTCCDKPIGELVRDRLICDVLSMNIKTGTQEWQPIELWSEVLPKEMVEVEIFDGSEIRLLRCSADHLVYTRNRGYVPAADLLESDEPILSNG